MVGEVMLDRGGGDRGQLELERITAVRPAGKLPELGQRVVGTGPRSLAGQIDILPTPTPSRAAPARPSPAQAAWIAGMCENRSRLSSLQEGPPIRGVGPGAGGLPSQFAEHAAMLNQWQVMAYLASARAGVRDLAARAARLPPIGVPAADASVRARARRGRAQRR